MTTFHLRSDERTAPNLTWEHLSGAAVLGLMATVVITGQPGELGADMQDAVFSAFGYMFTSPVSLVIIAGVFALEWFFPARAEQRGFSPSVLFDAFYLVVHRPMGIILIAAATAPLRDLLAENAGFLIVDRSSNLPMLVLLVAGVAIGDFILWLSHMIRHKVPFFWRFHMIHHSQTRMSIFTASRDHPLDSMVESLIMMVPLFFLFPTIVEDAQALTLYGLGVTWFIRFTHTNIRTNLGPLRYILVTPQSHRIHHSSEPEHWNSNYANIFCWDRLFGMQHPDDQTYPTTGVNDLDFPEPSSFAPGEFVRCFVRQMLFPFDTDAVHRATHGSPHEPAAANDG
jgi:sterol desaturase/sphingolipid hydroxylase (fatty acid hydroxylase superfamily)